MKQVFEEMNKDELIPPKIAVDINRINEIIPTIDSIIIPTIDSIIPTIKTITPTINTIIPTIDSILAKIDGVKLTNGGKQHGGVVGIWCSLHNLVASINSMVTKIEGLIKDKKVYPEPQTATIIYEDNIFKLCPEGKDKIIISRFEYKYKPKSRLNGFIEEIYDEEHNMINVLATGPVSDSPCYVCHVWFKTIMPNIGDIMYAEVNNTIYKIECLFGQYTANIQDIPYQKVISKELQSYYNAVVSAREGQIEGLIGGPIEGKIGKIKKSIVNVYNAPYEQFGKQYPSIIDLKYGYRYAPIMFYIYGNISKDKYPELHLFSGLFRQLYPRKIEPNLTVTERILKLSPYIYQKHIMQGQTFLCWCCAVMNKILVYIRVNLIIDPKSNPLDTLFEKENLQDELKGDTNVPIRLQKALSDYNPRDFYTTVFEKYGQAYKGFGFFASTFEEMIFTPVGLEALQVTHEGVVNITQEIKQELIHYVLKVDDGHQIVYIDSARNNPLTSIIRTGGDVKRQIEKVVRKEKIGKSHRNVYKLKGDKKYYVKVNNKFVLYKTFCKQQLQQKNKKVSAHS